MKFSNLRRLVPLSLTLCCSLGALALGAPRAQAATYTVTTTADNNTGTCTAGSVSDGCTLRAAITAANGDATTDNIVFAANLPSNTITLTTALPDVTTSLNITNPATQTITLARSSAAGTEAFNVLYVGNPSTTAPTVNLTGLTLTNGAAVTSGPSLVDRNFSGGGLYNYSGTLTLTNCTVSNNTALFLGGGIANYQGKVTLTGCTISGNVVSSNLGSGTCLGGGLYNYNGTVALANCTVSSNAVPLSGSDSSNYGGGLYIARNTATLTNCTVSGNSAPANHGSGISEGNGTTTLGNSIVAGNTSTDIDYYLNITSTYASNGYNVVGTSGSNALTNFTTAKGDQVGATANGVNLGPLQNNGGPTQTRALLPGSIAIDKGNTALTTDQRGIARPIGNADDAGAYEYNGTPSFVVTTTSDENNGTSDPTFGAGTSLREAIADANFYPSPTKTITFADNVVGQTITLNSALPDITTSLNISNTSAQTITLARDAGAARFNVLVVYSGGFDGDPTTAPTGSTVALQGLTLTGGDSAGSLGSLRNRSGGGLYVENSTVTLTACTLKGNTATYYGGGLFNYGGAVSVTNCTISGNTAANSINTISTFGGGIVNYFGTLSVTNSTISGNTTNNFVSTTATNYGGGLFNNGGAVSFTNSTVSGNTAGGNGFGGGLFSATMLTLDSCTVTGNTAAADQGSGISAYGGTVTLGNSIVAGNTNSDLDTNGGTYASNGYNLVSTGNGTSNLNKTSDKTGINPNDLKLGILADNGGPTQTIALETGSIAVNAGNTALTTDQRGVGRPFGGADDVGAYEFQGPFTESLVVTTSTDEDNNTSDPAYGTGTSLREAINYANKGADPSDITFADNVIGKTITLDTALPPLSTPLSIKNTGDATITLARNTAPGTPNFSILHVTGGGADLEGLTLTGGTGTTVNNIAAGGGLFNDAANITLTNCALSNNTAQVGGGLYSASTAILTGCVLSGNTATGDGGGALCNLSELTLTNCIVSGNAGTNASGSNGGGLYNLRSATVDNCVFDSNTATGFGGGIYNDVESTCDVTNATFRDNNAAAYGGAIDSDNCTVNLTGCTFANNSATIGGALDNSFSTFTLLNCTFSGNKATPSAQTPGAEQGGAISTVNGSTALNFCTITGNTAPQGGGISIYTQGAATTAARNVARSRGRSVLGSVSRQGSASRRVGTRATTSSTVTLSNSIVAGNTVADLDTTEGANAYISNNYNLVGTSNTGVLTAFDKSGDKTGVKTDDLHLGPLQDNGGPTQTIALQAGSIAINAGDPGTDAPATDQRGTNYPRVFGGRADVGAFEAQIVILKGRVYNAVGRAGLSDITVQATSTTIPALVPGGTSTQTDAQGDYTLYLEPGSYDITASDPNNAAARFVPSFTNPVEVTAAGTGNGNISYDLRSIGIGGRIISPNNTGIQGVTLSLTSQGSTTSTQQISDADGFFSFDGLAEGDYTLAPSGSSNLVFSPLSRSLTLADKPLFTSFKASAKITYSLAGRVTSGGQGIKNVTIIAKRVSDGQTFTIQTGADGSYSLDTLSQDRYYVTAQATGLTFTYAPTPAQPQPVILTAQSPTAQGLNFIARRAITGTVYNAVALAGLRGMVVQAVRASDGQSVRTTTDDSGAYSLSLEAGTYTLSATNPNSKAFRFISASFTNPLTVEVSVPGGAQTKRNAPGYDFRSIGIGGRVISPFNKGISNVGFNAYYEDNNKPSRIASSDSNGFFSLDGLLPGRWRVVIVSAGLDNYTYTPTMQVVVVQDQPVFISFKAAAKPGGSGNNGRSVADGQHSALVLSTASANAQADTLTLQFTGALDATSVAELSHYRVLVNGVEVSVSDATLVNGGDTIVLSLPEGTLTHGSQVRVGWSGVLDSLGLPLQGQTQLVIR